MANGGKSLICPLKHIFSSHKTFFYHLVGCEIVQSTFLYRRDIEDNFDWSACSLAEITQQNFELALNLYCAAFVRVLLDMLCSEGKLIEVCR